MASRAAMLAEKRRQLEELKTKIKATESVATVAHSVTPSRPTPPLAAPELTSQPPLQTATAAPPPARRYDRATQTENAAPTSVAKPVPATPRLAREARGTSPSRLSSNAHPSAPRGVVSDAGSLAAIPEADPGFSAFLSRASRTVEDVLWRPPPPLLTARFDSSLVGVGSSGADSGVTSGVTSGGPGAFDSAQRALLLMHSTAAGRPVGDMDWIRQVPDRALACYHSRSERSRGAEGLAIVWNIPSALVRRRARPGWICRIPPWRHHSVLPFAWLFAARDNSVVQRLEPYDVALPLWPCACGDHSRGGLAL